MPQWQFSNKNVNWWFGSHFYVRAGCHIRCLIQMSHGLQVIIHETQWFRELSASRMRVNVGSFFTLICPRTSAYTHKQRGHSVLPYALKTSGSTTGSDPYSVDSIHIALICLNTGNPILLSVVFTMLTMLAMVLHQVSMGSKIIHSALVMEATYNLCHLEDFSQTQRSSVSNKWWNICSIVRQVRYGICVVDSLPAWLGER